MSKLTLNYNGCTILDSINGEEDSKPRTGITINAPPKDG
jgi:hypothetical protein